MPTPSPVLEGEQPGAEVAVDPIDQAASVGPAGRLKLLLDTHHSRFAAEQLRSHGHDVEAAADDQLLAALPDQDLLRAAARHEVDSPGRGAAGDLEGSRVRARRAG